MTVTDGANQKNDEEVEFASYISSAVEDLPQYFTWQGKAHRVIEITRYWRVDVDWWRERIWRAYFKLRTESGLLVVIYQDLISGGWNLQRLYD